MTENIKRVGRLLEHGADKMLLAISMLLSWGFTYYSLRYTEVLWDGTENPKTVVDSIGGNLMMFLAVTIVFFLLRNLLCKSRCCKTARTHRVVVIAVMVYVTITSVVWVLICHVTPRADGSTLCLVAELVMQGSSYGTMIPPGYMSYNPHQFSLLMVIQLLYYLFGIGNYQAFQYMNALCMPLLFYSGYQLLRLIYGKFEPILYYIVFFVSCLPLFLYVPYVYGEITSTTFTMVLMWQVVRYCKTGKKTSWLWGTLAVVFACMMRMNSLIVLIAVSIVLMVYAIRSAKPQAVVWLLIMCIAVFATKGGIRAHYEKVSGNEMLDGIPYISYILMGLEDKVNGPGWFNGTNYREWMLHDYDTEQTAIDNERDVKERLQELWENKPYAIDFFRRKILSQWNSPDYHSIYETRNFDCEEEELPEFVRWIYYDNEDGVRAFMNRYQFIIYLCTAIMTTVSFVCRKQERQLETHILLVAVAGGFLFSIVWEAMSRYVLPYVVYVIPLASVGMWKLQELLAVAVEKLFSAKHMVQARVHMLLKKKR